MTHHHISPSPENLHYSPEKDLWLTHSILHKVQLGIDLNELSFFVKPGPGWALIERPKNDLEEQAMTQMVLAQAYENLGIFDRAAIRLGEVIN